MQQELSKIYQQLNAVGRGQLLAFAQFLAQRPESVAGEVEVTEIAAEPLEIPRPQEESVVAAMRRLANTYPMLNKDELLHKAAGLMSSHVLQGRPAVEVIDDLEALFASAYGSHSNGIAQCD
jgi:hypothetical protein